MKKLSILLILLIPIALAQERICPAVCIEMYKLEDNDCIFTTCGSGCGPDKVTTFKTLEECQAIPVSGIAPDSSLWTLDIFLEKLQLFFTPDKNKKIELRLKNINERVEEIRQMVNKNNLEAVELADEEKQIEEKNILKEVEGMPIEIKERVLTNLQKHITVLKEIRTKFVSCPISPCIVPKGIDNAIKRGEENIKRFKER